MLLVLTLALASAGPPSTIGVTVLCDRENLADRRKIHAFLAGAIAKRSPLRVLPARPREQVTDVLDVVCREDADCVRRALGVYRLESELELIVRVPATGAGWARLDDRRAGSGRFVSELLPLPVGLGWFELEPALGQVMEALAPLLLAPVVDRLVVSTEPEDALVLVDGRRCASPCALRRVATGTTGIEARASGHRPLRREVLLRPGPEHVEHLELESAPLYEQPKFWMITGAGALLITFVALFAVGG